MLLKIVSLFLVIGLQEITATTDKIVCYYGSWAIYRSGNGRFTVDDIDPQLCTHLIYTFVGIQDDGNVRHLDAQLDINRENFKKFNNLKQKNPNLKTLLAIGGWNEGSERYSRIATSATTRKTFIKSALKFVQDWGFDGFDLDWEYPGQRGGASVDKQNFALLLKEFRTEFDKYGLLLTAAVAATTGSVDLSYDVPALSKYLDFINIMAYDMHASWDRVTGQNAPLYPSSKDVTANQKLLTVDASIRGWIERGADPQKIVLGLPVYGQTFTLSNSNDNGIRAPCTGPGNSGPYTLEPGKLGYNEIVEFQNLGGWTYVWDDEQKTPYMYKGRQWVSFDNILSITTKVNYAKSLNLGGVMIWSIETEDFKGKSGIKYPILTKINNILEIKSNQDLNPEQGPTAGPDTTPSPEPVTEAKTETTSKESRNICTEAGYVRDAIDCGKFYYCLLHKGTFTPIEQRCITGLHFDQKRMTCDYPDLVKCK